MITLGHDRITVVYLPVKGVLILEDVTWYNELQGQKLSCEKSRGRLLGPALPSFS